ncbi:MAG: indolepyruvate ferredoxin oxidoreductase subunit alpha [Succinivibrio sp.]
MKQEYVMGNSAIAIGALCSGVRLVSGYPGTPSTEIIETIYHFPHEGVHLEWSVNEKAALEVAAAASYTGARTLVTMKQVGLNVASDPLMSLAYVGVKGGMVIVVADDPGPISSQTEQDTRRFAEFCRIPVLDPVSPEQAFDMVQDAFLISERYGTPVILRPTTRVCHGYASITFDENYAVKAYDGFDRDPSRFVIFPKLSYRNHALIEERNREYSKDISSYVFNNVTGDKKLRKGVVATGISYAYAREYSEEHKDVFLIGVGAPYPNPSEFLLRALSDLDEVICLEELSPYIEETIQKVAGANQLKLTVRGKLTGEVPQAGELSAGLVKTVLDKFYDRQEQQSSEPEIELPSLPVRPPVLCAGCPHRGAFYAVKVAARRKKAVFCGDIGCYTLGNAAPLDMVDTCLCMGAGITMAQGFNFTQPDTTCFAFIGDSTFFASGITGVINAIYNQANIIICILDNSTTAMTGHQVHPGTGINLMNGTDCRVDIHRVLEGLGVAKIVSADPLDLKGSVAKVRECMEISGVKAIIFKSPCITLPSFVKKTQVRVSDRCNNCRVCIKQIGCPAVSVAEGKVQIDSSLCTGCTLCKQVCPHKAIEAE